MPGCKPNQTPTCTACGEVKPRAEFHARKDGRQIHQPCKPCFAKRGAARYAAQREKILAQQKVKYAARTPEQKRQGAAARKAWAEKNRGAVKENHARWRHANAEHVRAASTAWRAANPEKRREVVKAWETRNPVAVRAKSWRRREREQASGTLSETEWREILRVNDGACVYCERADLKLTVDHVIPIARGGKTTAGNVVPACGKCNRGKSDQLPLNFIWRKAG